MQLARAVRNRTTGVLYVLDEPSIGLHPSNIVGLTGVLQDLVADGNSVILVDHDTQILKESDWLIEMGPEAGAKGGHIIAQGNISTIAADPASQIGPFLSGTAKARLRPCIEKEMLFTNGRIHLSTDRIHTVKPLEVDIPKGRLTVVTGVSGSGKTTMVLESLIPALQAKISGSALPDHIRAVDADGIAHVKLIDATPIGINVRSTVATYAGIHDELRKLYAKSPDAKALGYKAGDFSYNTGTLRCPSCDGTGVVSLDVQFLPDVNIPCPDCRGSRYSKAAYTVKLTNKSGTHISLPELMDMDVNTAIDFCRDIKSVSQKLEILKQLGLGYLTLGEETTGLSGGEAQRLKLASEIGKTQEDSVFVFDEPSIGLHPVNIAGLTGVMHDLVEDGNSVVLVDHDTQVLAESDWIIEMGPEAGAGGGYVIAQGTVPEIGQDPKSMIGPFLRPAAAALPAGAGKSNLFAEGRIHLSTDAIHTVHPLEIDIPKGRLTVVTGVSGSGKTTLILESLVPALAASTAGRPLPSHVKAVTAEGIEQVKLIDATPIGINVRSTVATYANVHDELRKIFSHTQDAKAHGYKAGDFSYNTGKLRCPVCDGTGVISLDVQFLPDVEIPCPACHGSRYAREADDVKLIDKHGRTTTLPRLMDCDVHTALDLCKDRKLVCQRLQVLQDLGLGYLTLGEETPSLSGGEAQRLKLASEMERTQSHAVFVFDEPTIGLHPLDVQTLLGVFRTLIDNGATVIVIEHDLDVIRSADYIVDMGPGGGEKGGRVVAAGTPAQIKATLESVTGRFL